MKNFEFKTLLPLVYVISVLAILLIAFKLMLFLLPFVIAALIVLAVTPLTNFIEKKLKIKSGVLKPIILILFYLIIGGIVTYLLVSIILEGYRFSLYLVNHQNDYAPNIDKLANYLNKYLEIMPSYASQILDKSFTKIYTLLTRYSLNLFNSGVGIIKSIPNMVVFFFIMVLSSFIIQKDKLNILKFMSKQFPESWLSKFLMIKKDVFKMLMVYAKAQLILVSMCFVELLIAYNIVNMIAGGIQFPLFAAFATAIVDALPVLGTGTVLIPWIIISFSYGNYELGICLIVVYAIVTVVRQYTEPKLMSMGAGVHPLATLIALYSGFKIFGVLGFLYGPIIMAILRIVFYEELKFGFFKFLVNEKREEE